MVNPIPRTSSLSPCGAPQRAPSDQTILKLNDVQQRLGGERWVLPRARPVAAHWHTGQWRSQLGEKRLSVNDCTPLNLSNSSNKLQFLNSNT